MGATGVTLAVGLGAGGMRVAGCEEGVDEGKAAVGAGVPPAEQAGSNNNMAENRATNPEGRPALAITAILGEPWGIGRLPPADDTAQGRMCASCRSF
jgi:hypothetical protein